MVDGVFLSKSSRAPGIDHETNFCKKSLLLSSVIGDSRGHGTNFATFLMSNLITQIGDPLYGKMQDLKKKELQVNNNNNN